MSGRPERRARRCPRAVLVLGDSGGLAAALVRRLEHAGAEVEQASAAQRQRDRRGPGRAALGGRRGGHARRRARAATNAAERTPAPGPAAVGDDVRPHDHARAAARGARGACASRPRSWSPRISPSTASRRSAARAARAKRRAPRRRRPAAARARRARPAARAAPGGRDLDDRAARARGRRAVLQHPVGGDRRRHPRRQTQRRVVQGALGPRHDRGAAAGGRVHGRAGAPSEPPAPDHAARP